MGGAFWASSTYFTNSLVSARDSPSGDLELVAGIQRLDGLANGVGGLRRRKSGHRPWRRALRSEPVPVEEPREDPRVRVLV
jgi:hypothetical protein